MSDVENQEENLVDSHEENREYRDTTTEVKRVYKLSWKKIAMFTTSLVFILACILFVTLQVVSHSKFHSHDIAFARFP